MDKRGKSKDQADDKMMYLIWNNIIDVMLTAADERYIDIYIYAHIHMYTSMLDGLRGAFLGKVRVGVGPGEMFLMCAL